MAQVEARIAEEKAKRKEILKKRAEGEVKEHVKKEDSYFGIPTTNNRGVGGDGGRGLTIINISVISYFVKRGLSAAAKKD